MKGNSIRNSVRGCHCDYSPRAPKNLATTLIATLIDRVVVYLYQARLIVATDCLNLLLSS